MRRIKSKFINNLTVKTKFILVLIIVIGAATCGVAIVRGHQVQNEVERLISERLQSNIDTSIGIINTVRLYTLWILDTVATMPQVQDILTGGDSDPSKNLTSLFASMELDEGHAYANIFLFDYRFNLVSYANPDGEFVDLNNIIFAENLAMAQNGMPFISPVFESPVSGLLQLLFTQPIIVDGTFHGMAAILGNTHMLDFFLRPPTYNYNSFINIADPEGTIFFSNRPVYMGKHLDDLGVYEALGSVPFNIMFRHNSAITGIDKVAYITIEPQFGWTIVSFFDAHAIESTGWIIFASLLPTVTGIALAAGLMVLIVHKSLTPLKALAEKANEVAHGNLEVNFNIRRNDEISQVSQSFLEIVKALNRLRGNFARAEDAMARGVELHKLEDSRLGGVFDEMITRTNNILDLMRMAKREAEGASKAKSDFLSKMSHEMRTPMNAIIGMAELILREDLPSAARDQASTIKQSGNHLLSIINDILDLSKVESGKLELVNTNYLFHSTIHDVVSIITMRMANPEVRFVVYMGYDIPNDLFGDEVRLRQILLNILSNAVKFTDTGHISMDITGIETDSGIFQVTMRIKDTGMGIKTEDVDKLFSEFAQFDLEKNRNLEGTGLGLAITQSLVKLMGGSIEVNSVYGEGSEFVVTLPQKYIGAEYVPPSFADKSVLLYCRTPLNTEYIARSLKDLEVEYCVITDESELNEKLMEGDWSFVFAETNLAYLAQDIIREHSLSTRIVMLSDSYDAAYEVRDGQDFTILIMPAYFISIVNILSGGDMGYAESNHQPEHFVAPEANILIVDDIDTNLKVGQGLLKIYEVDVDTCTSGKAAIEAVLAKDYDLVLMDHMMPEMDGVEAVRIIRSLGGKHADLPIAALTANAIVGAREMFLQNGFDDFLSKPIEVAKLNNVLAKWIPKQKQLVPNLTDNIDKATQINEQENSATEIVIEGVNVQRGIMFSGGDVQNYIDTLKVFHKDVLRKVGELAESLESNNIPLYTTYVHALKSACANIGAEKLSEEAKHLEEAGKSQDIDFITKHNNDFVNRLEKMLEGINSILPPTTEEVGAFDENALKAQLMGLKTALENFDAAAIDEFSEALQVYIENPDFGEALNSILQNAFIGKYKQAVTDIDELLL